MFGPLTFTCLIFWHTNIGRDRNVHVVGLSTNIINVYHHKSCSLDFLSLRGALDTLCDKMCLLLWCCHSNHIDSGYNCD
jgi:hypothetical protein